MLILWPSYEQLQTSFISQPIPSPKVKNPSSKGSQPLNLLTQPSCYGSLGRKRNGDMDIDDYLGKKPEDNISIAFTSSQFCEHCLKLFHFYYFNFSIAITAILIHIFPFIFGVWRCWNLFVYAVLRKQRRLRRRPRGQARRKLRQRRGGTRLS